MGGRIKMLRIEIDGHFHGSPDVPKPWVARITGVDSRYGLRREFIQRMNDWKDAKRACSGNLYGVVAHFPLRAGNLYEVSRLRGRPSKRHVAREFLHVDSTVTTQQLEPVDALAFVEGHRDAVTLLRIPDHPGGARVTEITGVGSGVVSGWVVVDQRRIYRLRHGHLYEIVEPEMEPRLVFGGERVVGVDQKGALEWLAARA